jgi:subtilisin family serine protease
MTERAHTGGHSDMKLSARLVPLSLAGILLAACAETVPTTPTSGLRSSTALANQSAQDFVAGQIVVRYKGTPSAIANRDDIPGRHRGKKKGHLKIDRVEIIEVAPGEELSVVESLRNDPDVEWAEPDYIMRVGPCEVSTGCDLPNGQFFAFKWDHYNRGSFLDPALGGGTIITGKADADIDLVELYDHLGPNPVAGSAVVGILDTGIRPTHSMFTGKIIGGHRFLGDTVPIGEQPAQSPTNFTDDHGHGSHVAGIAAGRGVAAVTGVAYGDNIKILVGKGCNAAGQCPNSSTAAGIIWLTDNGANVINMSFGSFGGNPDGTGSALQHAALQYALSKNVLASCSTGNDDNRVAPPPPAPPPPPYFGGIGYPSRFEECFAVGATDWGDTKASYSNYGPGIDISAPGGDGERSPYSLIVSASRNGDGSFAFSAGTSMAAPQVTGLAALLYSMGYTTPAAIRQRIQETADDIEAPGYDQRTGHGRINAYRAITGVDPNEPPVANPGDGYAGNKGVAVQFNGSASNDPNGKAITFAWNFGDPASASNTSTEMNPSHTYMKAGDYTVTLTVTDAANLSTTTARTAVIPNIVPAISFAGATILQGETYATNGSFADADPDSWTGSVDYGDATAATALTLSAVKQFSLSRRYMNAGAHSVTVAVNDDDGGNGASTQTVTVWTPQQGIAGLLLEEIDPRSALASVQQQAQDADGNMTSLAAKLEATIASLDREQSHTALNQLAAFVNHVQALMKSGKVAAARGTAWIATTDRIVASINR